MIKSFTANLLLKWLPYYYQMNFFHIFLYYSFECDDIIPVSDVPSVVRANKPMVSRFRHKLLGCVCVGGGGGGGVRRTTKASLHSHNKYQNNSPYPDQRVV